MKKIIFILVISIFTSCKKDAMKDIVGNYDVEGIDVRCSYYYCDTAKIKTIVRVNTDADIVEVYFQIYDSITNNFNFLPKAELIEYNTKEIIFSSESKNLVTIINRLDKSFMYRASFNAYNINLEDTFSRYLILNGYKQ